MKRIFRIFIVMLFSVSLFACSATREQQIEDDLAGFRAWISNTTSNVADRTEEDWKRAREDFKMRTQELDQKEDQFSAELKQEYQNLKQEFQDADEEYQKSLTEDDLSEWERNLLGRWADLASINENNVREAYITLLENVRQQRGTWDDEDWEMAKRVMEKLNDRKSEISGNIPTDTEVKIKALQMEFRTLETASDVSDGD
ncbi:hypothetical protein [Pontibacter anaerobius]|uniref:Uncharacterized protein n=1 Tax=Pontibacter anaerobius TaxID=2993940 RepID=A0ABT3RCN5_9BACT|nr:hypothetical protein [Pontibacter anaerobius]MCX2739117.1 hypothetical protein [Pontibacter anaerobius]